MIKIMKYGEVDNKDIFARGTAATSVEDIVTDIIENVKVFNICFCTCQAQNGNDI